MSIATRQLYANPFWKKTEFVFWKLNTHSVDAVGLRRSPTFILLLWIISGDRNDEVVLIQGFPNLQWKESIYCTIKWRKRCPTSILLKLGQFVTIQL